MNAEHEKYATWDAAYALGALAAPERAAFEAHLDECPLCRAAVAELGPTTALLSMLSADDAERIARPSVDDAERILPPSVDDAPVRLLAVARARRRARRRAVWAAVGIAAALVIAVPVGISAFAPRPAVEIALDHSAYVPATATVALTPVAWGTRLEMDCTYPASASRSDQTYVLTVVAKDGTASTLSTWSVLPGATAKVTAGTAVPLDEIRSVQIRDTAGQVLLHHDFGRG